MRTHHTCDEHAVTIQVEGLTQTTSFFHNTDAHISCDTEIDREYEAYSNRMNNAFKDRNTTQSFAQQILIAQQKKVDLIALTGDQINYPSPSSVSFVFKTVQRCGIPVLYTAGNHDWHFEGMAGSSHDLRSIWREKRLAPLYNGHNPSHTAIDLNGLCVVAIDNATYQVSEEQLAFFQAQTARNWPTVLLIHIPLFLHGTDKSPLCGNPAWGYATDRNYAVERRERWPISGNLPSTTAFLETVKTTPNLVAILCGHTHQNREAAHSNAVQYETRAGFLGGYRIFQFVPY
ncbi:MAG: metallophosphoesterase [bacterium]|jgi:predicted MPP superfamily phosphohydrolase|nr:metallophosphoesterase [bacterium]